MAFLVLLENLASFERGEVFDDSYPEIAQIVEKSEANYNCHQKKELFDSVI